MITIDGPSGAGKSTVSRLLAQKLGFAFLDTGAMYRAVGLAAHLAGIEVADESVVERFIEGVDLRAEATGGQFRLFLNGRPVGAEIRTAEAGQLASKASALSCVRRFLLGLQRDCGQAGDLVAEGRDMGSVVSPGAVVKFYLDAGPEVRARRRFKELVEAGERVEYGDVLAQTIERDRRDSTRDLAPLQSLPDMVVIDASHLDVDGVVAAAMAVITAKLDAA